MKFLVLGSGMMGSALAFDLARSQGTELVTIADIDEQRAHATARAIKTGDVRAIALDVNSFDHVVDTMSKHDCALGAVSYQHNVLLTRAAIQARTHFCDLGGNDDVLREQLQMSSAAEQAGITVIPNCGLAPGLANVIAAQRANEFEQVDSIHIRVGCVPQQPKPPFNYQIVFSAEGLLNEYTGLSTVLRNGTVTQIESLTEIETIDFPSPFGKMEAFLTSGGVSLLPQMFEGRAKEIDYKTIRYPGHCERFKALVELGFASNEPIAVGSNVLTSREFFLELIQRKLSDSGKDAVLMRIAVSGVRSQRMQAYECRMIDFFNDIDNITATMRMTAFPTSIITQFLVSGKIDARGVLVPEQCVPLQPLLEALGARGIKLDEYWY